MKKTLAMVLAAGMVATMLGGCSSGGSSTPATTAAAGGTTQAASNTAASGDVVKLSLATKVAADSFEGKSFQDFADLVKEYTNGTVEVTVYPSEQLGDSTTVVSNMQLGTVDMYCEGGIFYLGYGVDTGICSYPFLFDSWDKYEEIVKGDFGKLQEQQLESAGFKLINTNRDWRRGPYYVTCSTKPITSVADLKAMRLRSADSPVFMEAMKSLGVTTTVVNYSECYMALQQGQVDAVNCPISNVESMAFYEVGPYVTRMDCYPAELSMVMNLNKFNSLTADQQDALIRAANDAATHSNETIDKEVDDMIARLEAKGGVTFDLDFDDSIFADALKDYYKGLAAKGEFNEIIVKELGLN